MLFILAITSLAHSQTKVVDRSRTLPPPVELIDLKSHDQPFELGRGLKVGLTGSKASPYLVKNISRKDITFISISIDFTEMNIPGIFRHERFLGRPMNTKCCQHLPLLTLKVGASLRMLISDEYKAFGKTLKKYYGSASLSTITIVLGQVQFKEETM